MDKRDHESLELINDVFIRGKEKIGIRQIKMRIERQHKVVMNLKRIARIKNKFGLVTKIRRKNVFRKFILLKQEHETHPNILNRDFKRLKADNVYSTDITQLNYGKGQKAYLAVFKDLATKEIVASNISTRPDIILVNTALDIAVKKLSKLKLSKLMIHSDQGMHFTHFAYRKKLKENGILQSMSRRGNCLDNAPVESFFGHIKDHLELKSCDNFEKLKTIVTKEIDFYNYERPQWDLKKMPPNLYRRHLES